MKIDIETLGKIRKLGLPERQENNDSLAYSCYGDGVRADGKFNIKVYSGKRGLTVVTNDDHTFRCLLNGESTQPKEVKRTISIDDSGVGFLLGGVLCGIHDSHDDSITTRVIEVKFFQGDNRHRKKYLDAYGKEAVRVVEDRHPDKATTLIRICTGFVNTKAKEALRKLGYFVEVCEIKGKLQDELESLHKKYIESTYGYKGYIDPKGKTGHELSREFHKLKRWVYENRKQRCCKSDWGL